MFKNQKLQASYEDWHATAESVSQMTLIGSPIPADFVAAKLDALSLSSYEVSILEHALRAGILTTEKSFPKSIEEDSAQLRRATPLMGLGYRWEIDISAVDELPYPLRDLEKVRDNVERKLFRDTADLIIRWLKDIHDEIQKKIRKWHQSRERIIGVAACPSVRNACRRHRNLRKPQCNSLSALVQALTRWKVWI